jgi:type VI secretion system protein ImpB
VATLAPSLNFKVNNKLNDNDTMIPINLKFNSIRDFEPDQLINQIEPLRKLKLARDKLKALLNKAECSEELENILSHYLQDNKKLTELAKSLKHLTVEGNHGID